MCWNFYIENSFFCHSDNAPHLSLGSQTWDTLIVKEQPNHLKEKKYCMQHMASFLVGAQISVEKIYNFIHFIVCSKIKYCIVKRMKWNRPATSLLQTVFGIQNSEFSSLKMQRIEKTRAKVLDVLRTSYLYHIYILKDRGALEARCSFLEWVYSMVLWRFLLERKWKESYVLKGLVISSANALEMSDWNCVMF